MLIYSKQASLPRVAKGRQKSGELQLLVVIFTCHCRRVNYYHFLPLLSKKGCVLLLNKNFSRQRHEVAFLGSKEESTLFNSDNHHWELIYISLEYKRRHVTKILRSNCWLIISFKGRSREQHFSRKNAVGSDRGCQIPWAQVRRDKEPR